MPARPEELRRTLWMASGAFLAYGSWAAFANWSYGLRSALPSALTQATISFAVTATMVFGMESVFRRIHPGPLRFIATALGPQAGVAIVTATAHWVVGTPEILVTMAPSLVVGTLVCLLYTAGLQAGAQPSKEE